MHPLLASRTRLLLYLAAWLPVGALLVVLDRTVRVRGWQDAMAFVLPLVAATYAGHWIDERLPGYSVRGTLGGIVAGLVFGAVNVYLLLRERKP